MSWRMLVAVSVIAMTVSADAAKQSIGTITYGNDTFQIVYAAAYRNEVMGAIDLEFFNKSLPAGETFFTADSEITDTLRGMRLRISEDPAYKNGTWMYPTIQSHDQFYYFDESDPIKLTYKTSKDRISGSIKGEDKIGETTVKVDLTFDLPVQADKG